MGDNGASGTAYKCNNLADLGGNRFIPSTYRMEVKLRQLHSQYVPTLCRVRLTFFVFPSFHFMGDDENSTI